MKPLVDWTVVDRDNWIPCARCAVLWRRRNWKDSCLIPIPICPNCRDDIEETHNRFCVILDCK